MHNPVRGFLHGSAAIASVIGGVVLWSRADGDLGRQLSLLLFAASMVGLYTVSSLYHSVPWQVHWKQRMQRVDHSMIYLLIAGSYTPVAVVALDGWWRAAALGAVWAIAIGGILQKFLLPHFSHGWSTAMQIVQGWLALPLLVPLAHRLPLPAMLLLISSGLLYTAGAVFFVTQRPRLWPRVFSYHEMFHICVVAGSAAHYALTLWYVAPGA